jgi:UDP-glucose-4-epimerase GalE
LAHLLLTGGAGYVGSHALRALLKAGHTAVVIDDLSSGRREFVRGAPLLRCDVGKRSALERVLSDHGPFAGVIHFAASISVSDSVARPLATYANNVAASIGLIEVARAWGLRAFVLSSSAAVYGPSARQPIAESSPLAPTSPYGASKAMVERVLADAERAHGLRWMALRYFNAAGADPAGGLGECHEPETHLIPSALEAAAQLRAELSLYGTDYETPDGTCVRDYVHVTDLAEAHVRAVEALLAERSDGAYNLGTGRGHSNRDVVRTVGEVVGRPVPVREAPRRPGDPPVLVADATRFRREHGWEPHHSTLEEMVRTAWEWLRTDRGV